MPTDPNQHPEHPAPPHVEPRVDADHPGYEIEDVNTKGIAVFLAGLFGTVIIFFFVCYAMGKVINNLWEKEDGPANKWKVAPAPSLTVESARTWTATRRWSSRSCSR